jgi:ParB family chromosome partitioning protein
MRERAVPERASGAKGSSQRRRFSVDALFVDTRPQAAGLTDLVDAKEIPIERIEPDPDQPRRTLDQARLDELTASIRSEGVLQPIVVRYNTESNTYVIVHGERRWRASSAAGLTAIPALVRDVPAERRLVQQLMENIVRDDLNPVDRAAALRSLKQQLGDASWDDVAATVGIKRSRLFQLLGTEKLPEPVQDDLRAGRISEKQSRALQNLSPVVQLALRDEMVDGGLSADAAQAIARQLRTHDVPATEDDARAIIRELRNSIGSGVVAAPAPARLNAPSANERAQRGLAAVTAVARGDAARVPELTEFLTEQRTPARAYKRLDDQAATLAGTLARLHAAKQREREAARPTLEALRTAIDAILGNE